MSSSNCCFLTCIQVFQEAGQVVWDSHQMVKTRSSSVSAPEGSGPLNRHREPDLAPVLETPPGPVCIWLTRLAAPLLASGQPEGGGASGLGLLPHAPPIRAPGVAQMTPTLRLRPRVGRPPRACPHSGPRQGRLLGRPKAALVTVLVGPPPRPLLYWRLWRRLLSRAGLSLTAWGTGVLAHVSTRLCLSGLSPSFPCVAGRARTAGCAACTFGLLPAASPCLLTQQTLLLCLLGEMAKARY